MTTRVKVQVCTHYKRRRKRSARHYRALLVNEALFESISIADTGVIGYMLHSYLLHEGACDGVLCEGAV